MTDHSYWMKRALVLARKGLGLTHPNPCVGAIVVSAMGQQVGTGYHERSGCAHAEVIALAEAGERSRGGTLYVTLEPCCVQGRTGPCTEVIRQAHVHRVVIGCRDPNPNVNGAGVLALQGMGIDVIEDVLGSHAYDLIRPFAKWITRQQAFVTAKVAISSDGYIGCAGERVLITGSHLEPLTMKLRAEACTIVVGVHTVQVDDPQLTVRGRFAHRQPVSVVLDPEISLPKHCRLANQGSSLAMIVRDSLLDSGRADFWRNRGVSLWGLPTTSDRFSLPAVWQCLVDQGLSVILIEGGAKTLTWAMDEVAVDRWVIYRAAQPLTGGRSCKIPFSFNSHHYRLAKTRRVQADQVEVYRRFDDGMVCQPEGIK